MVALPDSLSKKGSTDPGPLLLRFTLVGDELEHNVFAAAFIELKDFSSSSVGLQEFGTAEILLQLFEGEYGVLTGV